MDITRRHYVYTYSDPRDGKVFYVGQGKERRQFVHLRQSQLKCNSPKNQKIKEILEKGLQPVITLVETELTETESLNAERKLIAFYGKTNLTNKTAGGQGASGFASFKGRKHTEEAKEKCRLSKLGKNNPMYGKHRTGEALRKFQEKMRGDKHPFWGKERTQETKDKISNSLIGFQWPDEEKVKRRDGMKKVWDERRKTGVGKPVHKKRLLTCGTVTLSVDDWVVKTGIKKSTIIARLRLGWTIEQALGVN